MQVLDEKKRQRILDVASALFATRPFHKVLLDDVAREAGVGKGTLYTYFENKQRLYLAVVYLGFAGLVEQLRERLSGQAHGPRESLAIVVGELVDYATRNPNLFELMRTVSYQPGETANWGRKRKELVGLVEAIIRRGIASGEFADPHPELTARFVPGLVRSAFLGETPVRNPKALVEHILRFITAALNRRGR